MGLSISGYVPCFNNAASVVAAARSLCEQDHPLHEVFVVDDGSTDRSLERLEVELGVRCVRMDGNRGRGAARQRAMGEAGSDLVLCCDATNRLPADFVRRLLPWFEDAKVAAVYGRIQDPQPKGPVGRWRARHLFKATHRMEIHHGVSLITYGTIVRRSAALEVGNFNPALRHTEDGDLGERLLAAGYDIVFDPRVPVFCNVQNTLDQVLERYWRWYAGPDERVSWKGYARNVVHSIRGMGWEDLKAGDPLAGLISLLCAHYQFWRSVLGKRSKALFGAETNSE